MPSAEMRNASRLEGRTRREPVTVKVIAYAPTVFSHCQHCEVTFGEVGLGERIRREAAANALPPDLALDFARLSDWVRRIVERHGAGIHVEVIDPASIEGIFTSLRHRVWRYPAVVVDGQSVAIGEDCAAAEPLIERAVERHAGLAPTQSTISAAGGERASGRVKGGEAAARADRLYRA